MGENLPTWVTILLSLISVLGGGAGVWLLNFYNARQKGKLDIDKQTGDHNLADKKQTSDIRISENEQAFKMYKDILEGLKQGASKMGEDMAKLEKDHLACREELAATKAENRSLTREVEYLKGQQNPIKINSPDPPKI